MYQAKTFFIKGQIPNVSILDLLKQYEMELGEQSVSEIQIEGNTLKFRNRLFRFVPLRFANKFSGFSSGRITIDETDQEYLVTLMADDSRTMTTAGIVGGAALVLSLPEITSDFLSLLTGPILFVLISGISYTITGITFPVYFTGVRNDIERKLQSR